MEAKVIAFTGPRPAKLCGWKHAAYKSLIDTLVLQLRDYYKMGIKKFISGGAQGFDMCAFLAVQKMKNRYGYEIFRMSYTYRLKGRNPYGRRMDVLDNWNIVKC